MNVLLLSLLSLGVAVSGEGRPSSWRRAICDADPRITCEKGCIFEGNYDGAPLTRGIEVDSDLGKVVPTACPSFKGEVNLANMGITALRPILEEDSVLVPDTGVTLAPGGPGPAFESMKATSLILSFNRIEILPRDTFQTLTALKAIDLSDNMIAVLPEGIFQSSIGVQLPLTSLILSKNRIETLSEGIFRGLASLSYLRLYGNKIAALPERIFQGLSSLEQLDLEKNEIAALPERIFEGLPLSIIYLDSNQISSLPERTFQGISSFTADTGIVKHHLTLLSLGNNQITILPEGVFRGLSSLRDLYLKNNNIEVLAKGIFRGLSSLSHLSLNDNRIAELPWGIFEGLPSLVLLYLHNNPLQCVPLTPQQRAKLLDYKGPETLCAPSTSGPSEGTTSTSPPSPVSLPGSSSVTDTQKSGVGVKLAPDQMIGVHGVKMAVSLPTLKEAFNSEAQSKFKQAIAAAGEVPLGTVTIDQIQALERRAGNTRVDVKVMASDAPAAESISKAITLDRINYELAKRGLPRASMLEPPSVFPTNAQEKLQLGQAGIAGIAVGGALLLCLVLGIYFYCGYIPEVNVYSMNDRLLRPSTSKEPRKSLEEGVPSDATRTKVRLPGTATGTQRSPKFAAIKGEVVFASPGLSAGLVFQDPVNGQVSTIASPIKKFVVSEDEYITNNTYITSEGVHFITPPIKSSEEKLLFF